MTFASGTSPDGPLIPRAYTLTHSDSTGDLFLTIARAPERRQISRLYTRLLRDEVLAEWLQEPAAAGSPSLLVHCHVSGGLVVGGAAWRYGIFRSHMPLVLESFRFGDARLFRAHPELDASRVRVRFHSKNRRYDKTEDWGRMADYRLEESAV